MKHLLLLVSLVLVSRLAFAGGPTLVPFKGPAATVSFPKGWVVQQENGVYAAQEDPKRKDAAAILFIYMDNTASTTEDQLLDTIGGQVATDVKTKERAVIKGGTGHYLIADGTSEGIKVRFAAIAVVANGKAIVSLIVAKTSAFDSLGGIGLAMQVMASIKPDAPAPVASPPPASPPKAGGPLELSMPARALTVADLAGDWAQDSSVVTSYAASSTSSGGYSAAATSEKWKIDATGTIYTKMVATTASSRGGAYQANEKSVAKITVSADGILTITHKKGEGSTASYVIRGWATRPDITVLQLNGPYYQETIPLARLRAEPQYASNLNAYWVRATPTK